MFNLHPTSYSIQECISGYLLHNSTGAVFSVTTRLGNSLFLDVYLRASQPLIWIWSSGWFFFNKLWLLYIVPRSLDSKLVTYICLWSSSNRYCWPSEGKSSGTMMLLNSGERAMCGTYQRDYISSCFRISSARGLRYSHQSFAHSTPFAPQRETTSFDAPTGLTRFQGLNLPLKCKIFAASASKEMKGFRSGLWLYFFSKYSRSFSLNSWRPSPRTFQGVSSFLYFP